ncbi:MAG: hypothetical protein IT236_18810 [Bacteroidia bacterium]|nr:hypothetical protein [Bacteroidia bacterium]
MKELIKIIARHDLESLAGVRTLPGLLAAINGDEIWLKGIFVTGKETSETLKIAAQKTFVLGADNLLFPPDGLTPVGKLPALDWQPLPQLLPLTLPTAALGGKVHAKAHVQLVPSQKQEEIYATELSLNEWLQHANNISMVRLCRVKFAIGSGKRVLVLNSAIISLPGKFYWKQQNNLLPLGYDFNPSLMGELIGKKLNPDHQNLLVFDTDGSYTSVALDNFMDGNRALLNQLSTPGNSD